MTYFLKKNSRSIDVFHRDGSSIIQKKARETRTLVFHDYPRNDPTARELPVRQNNYRNYGGAFAISGPPKRVISSGEPNTWRACCAVRRGTDVTRELDAS